TLRERTFSQIIIVDGDMGNILASLRQSGAQETEIEEWRREGYLLPVEQLIFQLPDSAIEDIATTLDGIHSYEEAGQQIPGLYQRLKAVDLGPLDYPWVKNKAGLALVDGI